MARTFGIITTSKGRLEHLKLSLPQMLRQSCHEVIVVDYSCPDATSDYVEANFPSVRVVSVPGEEYFSNWKARNAGASVAESEVLLFCDADTILADGAVNWLSRNLPEGSFGYLDRAAAASFNTSRLRLASNQLRGFHVIPTAAFRRVGGYDEVLQGYAAGGDTDLEERLIRMGVRRYALNRSVVASVVEHDNADRRKHHRDPVPVSYAAGLLYRSAKSALLGIRRRHELPLQVRETIYSAAKKAASAIGSSQDKVSMTVAVDVRPILMPRQLGYGRGVQRLSISVEISLEDRLEAIPD